MRNGYDAFISHNRADKALARSLAGLIGTTTFHGRLLRPWLDEQYLDPGDLGRETELTSALDRSRMLLLVLSPTALASRWVGFELEYFLADRPIEDVVCVLAAPCEMPRILAGTNPIDVTGNVGSEALEAVIARLCPPGGPAPDDAAAGVDDAWAAAVRADPGGLDAEVTPQHDALLAALLRHDIAEPSTEGVALAGFWRAADRVRDIQGDDRAYNLQMLLGECLAVAIISDPRYRQVAQRYLDAESGDVEDPVLTFVVARASSKLAEVDPAHLDLGSLLRIASKLDAGPLNGNTHSVAMLVGRIASKLRGTDAGDLLITTLSDGGPAARVAAIGAISGGVRAPSAFYLSELEAMHATGGAPERGALVAPSRMLQALLVGIDLDYPEVRQSLDNAKYDLSRDFGIDDLPYGYAWFALRDEPPADQPHRAPFMGTVAKATADTMEDLALRVDATHVVCLTQPRIVDALFERAGALLILPHEDPSQAQRLIGRDVPFAVLDADRMAQLDDGDQIVVEPGRMRVVRASRSQPPRADP